MSSSKEAQQAQASNPLVALRQEAKQHMHGVNYMWDVAPPLPPAELELLILQDSLLEYVIFANVLSL